MPSPYEVSRPHLLGRLRARLSSEKHVALYGLAGSGKTTLAAALAREYASKMPVFWMTVTESVTASEDALIHQLARFLHAHGQNQIAPMLRADRNPAAALPLDRQVALIGAALNAQPLLMCIHNIHLIQQNTRMMQVLQHFIAATPVHALFTSCEQVPLNCISQIAVGGLEEQEGIALIDHLAGAAIDRDLALRLLDRTGGNPMLLRLAIGQLMDEKGDAETFLTRLETRAQLANYLIETVLRKLTPVAWDLSSLLSVLRQPVDLCDGRLAEIAFGPRRAREMDAAAKELQRHNMIDSVERAKLTPLIHDFIYGELKADPAARVRLHRSAAQWVEEVQQDGLEAAYRWSRAGVIDAAADVLESQQSAVVARGQERRERLSLMTSWHRRAGCAGRTGMT